MDESFDRIGKRGSRSFGSVFDFLTFQRLGSHEMAPESRPLQITVRNPRPCLKEIGFPSRFDSASVTVLVERRLKEPWKGVAREDAPFMMD